MIDGEKNFASKYKDDEDIGKLYQRVSDAYEDKKDQSDDINNNWDVWTCTLNNMQSFQGDSQIYVPAVRDCIEARVKRIMSTCFPPSERFIRAVSETGDNPLATISMIEHHLRQSKFNELAPGLLRYGDIEGQWSIYIDWLNTKRLVTRKKLTHPLIEPDVENPEAEPIEDVEEEELVDERPDIWIIPSQDLAVLPATCDHIMDAELVCVILRETKEQVRKKIKRGIYDKQAAQPLLNGMETKERGKDAEKERAKDAGVKVKGKDRYALVYQVWTDFEIDGEMRPVVMHFGGQNSLLGVHKNPYWCQLPPIISSPPIKVPGSFFGLPKVTAVKPIQYQ